MNLRYTSEMREDIRRLRRRIADTLGNPSAAGKVVASIIHTCANLKRFPLMEMEFSGKIGCETYLRFLVCEKQIIFYRVNMDHISVTRVLGERANYLQVFF